MATNITSPAVPVRRPGRFWSAVWTALLIPFVFLPYRFLFLPCGVAAMLMVWPLRGTLRDRMRMHGTLIVGAPLVLVLRTALDPAWWLPWLGVVAVLALVRGRGTIRPWAVAIVLPLIWLSAIGLLLRPGPLRARHSPDISARTVLVCAGDSLTSGVEPGTDRDTYVARLRARLPCPVMNAGRASDRVKDVLKRIDRTVLSHQPDVGVLFVGGNDSLDGTPRAEFAGQLESAAARITASGARLVLVEVPAGIVWNPYAGLYRQVARRHHAIFVPETRLRLWFTLELIARTHLREPLTIDGIHLSPAGATRVADWLEPYVRQSLSTLDTNTAQE